MLPCFEQRHRLHGHGFAPTDFADAFAGLGFQVDAFGRNRECPGERLAHGTKVAAKLGLLGHDHAVNVADLEAEFVHQIAGMFEESEARSIFPVRVVVGKMLADVAEPGGAEQGITNRVRHRIAVRVPGQALVKRYLHPAQDEFSPRR